MSEEPSTFIGLLERRRQATFSLTGDTVPPLRCLGLWFITTGVYTVPQLVTAALCLYARRENAS